MSQTKRPIAGIRVWVAANGQLVRECLSLLIERSPQFTLAGVTTIASDRIEVDRVEERDVVVVYLEPVDHADAVESIAANFPKAKVVVITEGNDIESSRKVIGLGAVGVLRSSQRCTSLLEAIRKAYEGETWLNQDLLNSLVSKDSSKRVNGTVAITGDSLTPRETEVVSMIGKGLKSKLIALQLGMSEATVRHHLSSIYGKLGLDDRLNLAIYAIENGFVELNRETDIR